MSSLLARSRVIRLAGTEIETPLLMPAISSKALGPVELTEPGKRTQVLRPASMVHTDVLIRSISEAVLISAYDIHHRFVHNPGAFRKGFQSSVYSGVKVIFIDSGWYEKSVGIARGPWYHEVSDQPPPFEPGEHTQLIDSLDRDVPAVIVNWDSPGATYAEQIRTAQDFFGSRKRFSSDLLLKPSPGVGTKAKRMGAAPKRRPAGPTRRRYHDFNTLSGADVGRLRAFDVVGVTEKELGDTLLKRLTSLAQLRDLMDKSKVDVPIHVFGGLDPLVTPLYVAAGAEIFDGLTWLRYSFRDGLSISSDNGELLEGTYSKTSQASISQLQLSNLSTLEQLAQQLKVFVDKECDWAKLRRGDDLRPVFEAFEAASRSNARGR